VGHLTAVKSHVPDRRAHCAFARAKHVGVSSASSLKGRTRLASIIVIIIIIVITGTMTSPLILAVVHGHAIEMNNKGVRVRVSMHLQFLGLAAANVPADLHVPRSRPLEQSICIELAG
jgi:hypothetical protein